MAVRKGNSNGGTAMHFSTNVSHWVCLVAGAYLVLTGLMLREVAREEPPACAMPAGSKWGRHRVAGYGRRAVMIGVGLVAVAYGISRLVL
jgi:hypothetical protein